MSLKVNQTPVRTSRNFRINNLNLEDIQIPEITDSFENVRIISEKSIISNETNIGNLVYGSGDVLTDNNYKNCNNKIKIETAKEDVIIIYDIDDNNTNLINQIEIDGENDSTVYIMYQSKTEKAIFQNSIIKTVAKNKCNLNVIIINLINNNSNIFQAFETIIEDDAIVNYTIIDLGGKISVTNYFSNIIGQNGTNNIKTIYLGKDDEIKDLNYISHLRGEKSIVDIDIQGALDGNAKKNFKGTIDFKQGCKGSKGSENEFCLLLSDKAKGIALPMLLCTEDDVEGAHSTACGKVENDALFYIMSRGVPYKEAIKLIVKSRFNNILDIIKHEETKQVIISEIDKRLG